MLILVKKLHKVIGKYKRWLILNHVMVPLEMTRVCMDAYCLILVYVTLGHGSWIINNDDDD